MKAFRTQPGSLYLIRYINKHRAYNKKHFLKNQIHEKIIDRH